MTTFEAFERFHREFGKLTPEQRRQFLAAARALAADLNARQLPRPSLRVKRVQGQPGVFEMTWAPDGRATFHFGAAVRPDEAHIQWRRVGTHDIFTDP